MISQHGLLKILLGIDMRERVKANPLNRHPKELPYYIKLHGSVVETMHEEAKDIFEFMKSDKRFHADPGTYMAPDQQRWEILKDNFPFAWEFKQEFNMTNTIVFLEFNNPETYSHRPHTHNTNSGTGLFFTIKHSDYAGTAFYEPKQENIDIVRHVLDNGTLFEAEDCHDTEPVEIVQMTEPHVIALNSFHNPIIIEEHPDNFNRVTMNWSSRMGFLEFAKKVSSYARS